MKVDRIQSIQNDFEHLTDWMIGEVRTPFALRISCHQCGATEVIKMPHNLSYSCPQPAAERAFRNRGWVIGRRRKLDMCPACAQEDRDKRNARRTAANVAATTVTIADVWPETHNTNVIELKPVAIEEKPVVNTVVTTKKPVSEAISVTPPREMSRADKRIIFSKLDEVYSDEKSGYSNGWSDQRVATDLGVPLAWVTEIRDDSFGPEGHSPEAKALFEEVRKMLQEARSERENLAETVRVLNNGANKLSVEIDRLERKLALVEKGKI